MESVRASIARSLQSGVGNRAVGHMLMRDPPAAAPPKIAHKTGKEVDDALDASPYFAKLVEAKHKAGTKAEGHVHIHADAAFEDAYVKMALKRTNPTTGKVFTEEEARARSKNVNAFRDGSELHVHENRGTPGTAVHEAIHLFADAYRDKMGYNANEGTTEYFTRKLCAELKLPRGTLYASQLASVEKLITAVGEDVVAAAYFQDKLAELETALDAKKEAGTFANVADRDESEQVRGCRCAPLSFSRRRSRSRSPATSRTTDAVAEAGAWLDDECARVDGSRSTRSERGDRGPRGAGGGGDRPRGLPPGAAELPVRAHGLLLDRVREPRRLPRRHGREPIDSRSTRRFRRRRGGRASVRAPRAPLRPVGPAERRHRELRGPDHGRALPDALEGLRFAAAEDAGQRGHSVVLGRRWGACGLDTQDTG